jgi:hypothetical protein
MKMFDIHVGSQHACQMFQPWIRRCTKGTLNNFTMEKTKKWKEALFSIGPKTIYCINLIPDVSSNYQLRPSINFIRLLSIEQKILFRN